MHLPVRATRRSRKRDVPFDLVQNTAEYLGRVAGLLSFRGVSTEWQGAVSDAVGFLNGRCWNRLEAGLAGCNGPLWTSLRVDGSPAVARCAVLCLRPRLETLDWLDEGDSRSSSGLRLLGENNTTLTALSFQSENFADSAQLRELRGLKRLCLGVMELEDSMIHAVGTLHSLEVLDLTPAEQSSDEPSRPMVDLGGLQSLVALRELILCNTAVSNDSFAGLDRLLSGLHKLDLSHCTQLTAISNLAPCISLRELHLSFSGVESLEGLEKLVALETLTLEHGTGAIKDWSTLRRCPQLVALAAEVKADDYAADEIQAMVDSTAHCLVRWRLHNSARESPSHVRLPSFLRCAALTALNLRSTNTDNVAIQGLAEIPTLQVLDLSNNPVNDVRALGGCRALRDLHLNCTSVTAGGITGLERIATLETLDFTNCPHLTSVTSLRHCAALRELKLACSPITNAGIEGLECIATLTILRLNDCEPLTCVSSLRHIASLRELNISYTQVTGAGIVGLEEIGTLERLDASGCEELDDVTTLRKYPIPHLTPTCALSGCHQRDPPVSITVASAAGPQRFRCNRRRHRGHRDGGSA
jgi:Leucine-rich repeat (LRR) protein